MKIAKGQYGYNAYLRKTAAGKTILLFAVAFSLFFAGYIHVGTRNNLLTVVAILGCLPASKSAVNMIMAFRAKGCSRETAKLLKPFEHKLCLLYDLYMTSEKQSYDISCMAVAKEFLYGYTENEKTDADAAEKHIRDILKANARPTVPVKILTDREAFLERLHDMEKGQMAEAEYHGIEEIAQLLKAISL